MLALRTQMAMFFCLQHQGLETHVQDLRVIYMLIVQAAKYRYYFENWHFTNSFHVPHMSFREVRVEMVNDKYKL